MKLSLTHSMTGSLAIGFATVALAACGGDDGDNGNASARESAASSGIVSIQSVDGTEVLADPAGRTLYGAEVEEGGQISCTEACTAFWDPLGASAGEAASAAADLDLDLDVIRRPDGEQQLTLDGLPLYTFTDEGPGELDGDGFVDDFEGTHFEWVAATTDAGAGSGGSDAPSDGSLY
jgi:predicted lipoprotein with Yx(FWY)xxD motif